MARQIVTGVFLVAGLALFVGLGLWQVERLVWKQSVIAGIEARIGDAPAPLPAVPDPDADLYLPVAVTGAMGGSALHVLVSSRDYGAGFRLIAPFTLADGRRIMVDRGYVPSGLKEAPRSTGPMTVTGNLHWPQERDAYTPEDDPDGNWWYARDVTKMAAALGTEPVLLVARTPTDPQILPMPVSAKDIPNDHLGYAITWFLLAATWAVMTVFALWRIRRRAQAGAGGLRPEGRGEST